MERRFALSLAVALSLVVSLALAFAAPALAPAAESAPATSAAESAETAGEIAPRPQPVTQRIDLSLRDADLVEVLRSFAKLGGFNLVIDPGVKGRVTVELRDVRWDAALVMILRTHGLSAEVNGRIVSVAPQPQPPPRR